MIASVLCSQSVLEVGTISQSFDFFVTSRMRFAGKFYQKYLFFAYVRAGEAAQGPPVNYKPHKSQFAIPCLVSNVNQCSGFFHIRAECTLSGPKFSCAETGMGVTYGP